MRTLTIIATAAGSAAILLTGTAQAVPPADKCEAEKLKRAGKYSLCRLKAEAKAVKTGDTPDYSKCDTKLSEKWTDAETDASGMCPTNGDLTSIQARVTGDSNDIVACLDGACPPSPAFPATGQTTSYGPGSDGDLEAGAALSYTDNGDGTITDNNTGLMWEKKSDDGSIHDWNNNYTWGMNTPPYTMNGTMVTTFLHTLNDVGGGGTSCFAGYCDWRIPNVRELLSIVSYEVPYPGPSVDAAFNTACAPACTVLTCSCTTVGWYWSSTTFSNDPESDAVFVNFAGGFISVEIKNNVNVVRAVRGGS